MIDLEYKIGGININPDRLKFEGFDPCDANYKFLVEAQDNVIFIYIAQESKDRDVAEIFNVRGQKVGGGNYYLNGTNKLVLDDFSLECDAIPKEVAQIFAELTLPKLQKLGVEVSGIAVDPNEFSINPFWKERGFGFQ